MIVGNRRTSDNLVPVKKLQFKIRKNLKRKGTIKGAVTKFGCERFI